MFVLFYFSLLSFVNFACDVHYDKMESCSLSHFESLPNELHYEIFKHIVGQKSLTDVNCFKDIDSIDRIFHDVCKLSCLSRTFERKPSHILETYSARVHKDASRNVPLNISKSKETSIAREYLQKKHEFIYKVIASDISWFARFYEDATTDSGLQLGNALVNRIAKYWAFSDKIEHYERTLHLLIRYNLCDPSDYLRSLYEKVYLKNHSSLPSHNTSFLELAFKMQDFYLISFLLKRINNINEQDENGNTILMRFLMDNTDPNITQLFLKHGADVNIKNRAGQTGLTLAYSNLHNDWTILANKSKEYNVITQLSQKASQKNRRTNFFTMQNILYRTYDATTKIILVGTHVAMMSLHAPIMVPRYLYKSYYYPGSFSMRCRVYDPDF